MNNDSPQTNGTKSPYNQSKQRDQTKYIEKVKWKWWDFSTVNMKRLSLHNIYCAQNLQNTQIWVGQLSQIWGPLPKSARVFLITISNKLCKMVCLIYKIQVIFLKKSKELGKFWRCSVSDSRCCGLAPK